MGDSSIFPFLQSMRIVVENTVGPMSFTVDPIRHTIAEPLPTAPPSAGLPCVLLGREAVEPLVQSYFTNVGSLPGIALVQRQRIFRLGESSKSLIADGSSRQ